MKPLFIATIPVLLFFSCQQEKEKKEPVKEETKDEHDAEHDHHGAANEYMHGNSYEELVANFESDERTSYQQPEKVLEFLGDLTGKKILDLGAGTGYFSFRLANKGAHVIAADVDENFQDFIRRKKDSLKISDDQIELRIIPYDSPGLSDQEVDMVLIVNTYHHLENRKEYFKLVKSGMKKGGRLVIIDYKKEDLPVGPPAQMKMSPEEVTAELNTSGFKKIEVNADLLKYQYIIIAQ